MNSRQKCQRLPDIFRRTLVFHHIHSIRFHHHSGPTSSHANGIHLVWLVRFRDWLEEKPFVEDRSKGFGVFFLLILSPSLLSRQTCVLLQLLLRDGRRDETFFFSNASSRINRGRLLVNFLDYAETMYTQQKRQCAIKKLTPLSFRNCIIM